MTDVDGVLVVDKPPGMTSHDVVARVRRAAGQRRVGHAGTLDPDATGVLVVCLGRGTRLVPYVQASTKTYEARVRLGASTTTLDASGAVVARRDASGVDERALCETLQGFVGTISQVPPMVSAVKVDGERLYAKARRGEEIARPARTVTIAHLVLEDFEPGPRAEATLLVGCSAGTYIRALAADVGDRLGVGGHLVSLRRLASGRFSLDRACSLQEVEALGARGELQSALLAPAEAVADYPTVTVDDAAARALGVGRSLAATGHRGPVAAVDAAGHLVAMVEDRGSTARPLAVLAPYEPHG